MVLTNSHQETFFPSCFGLGWPIRTKYSLPIPNTWAVILHYLHLSLGFCLDASFLCLISIISSHFSAYDPILQFFQLSLHSLNVFFAFFSHVSFVQPVDINPLFNYVKPEFCPVTIFLNWNQSKFSLCHWSLHPVLPPVLIRDPNNIVSDTENVNDR